MARYEVWRIQDNTCVEVCQTAQVAEDIANAMSHTDLMHDYKVKEVIIK